MYKRFLVAVNKLIDVAVKLNGHNEVGRMALSFERLADDRFASRVRNMSSRGEIYQFEFGRNYFPEMSFEHRGLVVGSQNMLLYVLPICSYNSKEPLHKSAYHPVDNPDSKQEFFLLKSSEFNFLKHDSVLKLSDLRTISTNRLLYKHKGTINVNSDTYKEIESLVLQKYFQDFYFEFNKLKENYENVQKDLSDAIADKEMLEEKLKEVSAEQKEQ
jgi:hypothetical protein